LEIDAKTIKEIIKESGTRVDVEGLDTQIPLRDQNIDSLDLFNILLLIEEKFKLKIPDEDIYLLVDIENIIKYLIAVQNNSKIG
jgi:acyl carrier protein